MQLLRTKKSHIVTARTTKPTKNMFALFLQHYQIPVDKKKILHFYFKRLMLILEMLLLHKQVKYAIIPSQTCFKLSKDSVFCSLLSQATTARLL